MKRIAMVTAVLAACLVAIPASAQAAPTKVPAPDPAPTSVTINGRTFGPESGLTVTSGSVDLPRLTKAHKGDAVVSPMTTTQWSWGTSWTKTVETAQIMYDGYAYAAGNVYNSQRIIEVCFKYTRGGVDVSSWYCSDAYSNGSAWYAGSVAYHGVYDSLDPNAPPTTFHYSLYQIDPRIM